MPSLSLSVLLCTNPLASHWVGSWHPLIGPLLVKPPPLDQLPVRLWRRGHEVSWEDPWSHSGDLLKQLSRGRVALSGLQRSSAALHRRLFPVPHKHQSSRSVFVVSCLALWFWMNFSSLVKPPAPLCTWTFEIPSWYNVLGETVPSHYLFPGHSFL